MYQQDSDGAQVDGILYDSTVHWLQYSTLLLTAKNQVTQRCCIGSLLLSWLTVSDSMYGTVYNTVYINEVRTIAPLLDSVRDSKSKNCEELSQETFKIKIWKA